MKEMMSIQCYSVDSFSDVSFCKAGLFQVLEVLAKCFYHTTGNNESLHEYWPRICKCNLEHRATTVFLAE